MKKVELIKKNYDEKVEKYITKTDQINKGNSKLYLIS
jgi:hypothetical protein